MQEQIEFQTRSNSSRGKYGGLNYFRSIDKAYGAWKEDPSIWKISWSDGEIDFRYLVKTKKKVWHQIEEDRILELYPRYSCASKDQIFWVYEKLEPQVSDILIKKKILGEISEEEYQKQKKIYKNKMRRENIVEVLTDEEFRLKYKIV